MRPRTHMVLTLPCEGREWLADVRFGGDGLLEPIALDGTSTEQAGVLYQVATAGPLRVLQRHVAGAWEDLYALMPDPVHAIDFEVGNWFTSTHPGPFVLNLTAQRMIDGTRLYPAEPDVSIGAPTSGVRCPVEVVPFSHLRSAWTPEDATRPDSKTQI